MLVTQDATGCPAPEQEKLLHRLLPLKGGIFRVELPYGDAVTGYLSAITDQYFVVDGTPIYYGTSFCIYLNNKTVNTRPYDVAIKAEAIGGNAGQFVRRGLDFIEINQGPPEGVARVLLYPINEFVNYHCSPKRDE